MRYRFASRLRDFFGSIRNGRSTEKARSRPCRPIPLLVALESRETTNILVNPVAGATVAALSALVAPGGWGGAALRAEAADAAAGPIALLDPRGSQGDVSGAALPAAVRRDASVPAETDAGRPVETARDRLFARGLSDLAFADILLTNPLDEGLSDAFAPPASRHLAGSDAPVYGSSAHDSGPSLAAPAFRDVSAGHPTADADHPAATAFDATIQQTFAMASAAFASPATTSILASARSAQVSDLADARPQVSQPLLAPVSTAFPASSGNTIRPLTAGTTPPDFVPVLAGPAAAGQPVRTVAAAAATDPAADGWSVAGVRYADGAVRVVATDLDAQGFNLPWGQARSWSNVAGYANGRNGNGWVDENLPLLLDPNGDGSKIVAIATATDARTFDLVSGNYVEHFFLPDGLTHNTGASEFLLVDSSGSQVRFNDFATALPANQRGSFKSLTDAGGNVLAVTSYTTDGKPAEVQRSVGSVVESYQYAYVASGVNAGLLQSVVLRRSSNGGSSWTTVRQVQYAYYDGTQSYGNAGDLLTATVQDGAGNTLDQCYYRYYTSADIGTIGYVSGLKYAFSARSYARLLAAYASPGTATDSQVSPYADRYFEYDASHRVTTAIVQGEGCSVCSGGLGSYTYAYATSGNAAGFNSWAVKTTETLADSNQNIVYTNAYAEAMLAVYKDVTSGLKWDTFAKFDATGRVALTAAPSAVTGYDDTKADLLNSVSNNYQYLSDTTGKLTVYDYFTTTTATETTAGGVAGYLQDVKLRYGETGTGSNQPTQEAWQYFAHTAGGVTVDPVASDTAYRNTDGTGAEATSFTYTWFTSTVLAQSMTTSLPVVTTAENGPGTADVSTIFNDTYGRPIWTKDGDGFLTYTAYDAATGAATKAIADVNTANTGDFTGLPSGWTTPSGGGLHLITLMSVDALGRDTQLTSPGGNVTYVVYNDPAHETLTYRGWIAASGTPTGPTEVMREDRTNGYVETFAMSATPHLTGGVPDGTEAISGLQTLTRDYYNTADQRTTVDAYFDFTGLTYTTAVMGTAGVNFYQTAYAYDNRGRQCRTLAPTGTISREVMDGLGRVVSTWIGTNDTPASGSWSPTNNTSPSNMVQTTALVYDGTGTGGGQTTQVGDGTLTQVTAYPGGGAAARATQTWFDWRDRAVATKEGVQSTEDTTTNRPLVILTLDNRAEVTTTQQFDGDTLSPTASGGTWVATSGSTVQLQTGAAFDEQARPYQFTQTKGGGLILGPGSQPLTTNRWYDHRGEVVKESAPGGLVTKSSFDGAGRLTFRYTTDGGGDTAWADALNVTGDAVLQQIQSLYDSGNNVIETIAKQRFDNETTTGALGDIATAPKARVTYAASYYDNADRVTASVDVGTNAGSAWTRPSSVPAASDTALVTQYAFNAAGWVQDITDPRGLVTRTLYDALERTTKTIANYTGAAETATSDVATEYTYDGDNHTLTIQADEPGGSYQQTKYIYAVTTAGGSAVNSNDLLSAVQHPDPTTGNPSSSQQDSYLVNALGQNTQYTDRDGNVHQYTFDVLSRITADAVTTLGSGVDGAVRRLTTAYDAQGNPYLFTSYNASSGGSIVNQVQDAFNGFGQLITEYQAHGGAVNINTSLKVQYAYVEGSGANNSRLTTITYPNGRVLTYNYATGLDDTVSRLTSITDTSGTLESYKYLGLDTVAERDHPLTNINLTYISQTGGTGDAGDKYVGLDRFGRVVDQNWYNTSTSTSTDEFQYGYDRDNNALWRQNVVNTAFGELYTYDNLNQLATMQRGTLNAQHNGLTGSASRSQNFTPDALGNFSTVTSDGTAQTRTHDQLNRITTISGLSNPTYDADGNLTADGTGQTYVYDAWNRLVTVKQSGTTVAAYTDDALGRRIKETHGSTTTDVYFSKDWQVLEERRGANVDAQNTWSPVYVNALIKRDQSSAHNGTLDQHLWAQQDANWDVTALTSGGTVVERYVYDAFGKVSYFNASWGTISSSAYAALVLFQGGRYDNVTTTYNFQHRDLLPSIQRWLEADPFGLVPGLNWYRYVDNAPIIADDASGQQTKEELKKQGLEVILNTLGGPGFRGGAGPVAGSGGQPGPIVVKSPVSIVVTTPGGKSIITIPPMPTYKDIDWNGNEPPLLLPPTSGFVGGGGGLSSIKVPTKTTIKLPDGFVGKIGIDGTVTITDGDTTVVVKGGQILKIVTGTGGGITVPSPTTPPKGKAPKQIFKLEVNF